MSARSSSSPSFSAAVLESTAEETAQTAPAADAAVDPAPSSDNRRAHERISADHLWWLRGARVKYGKDVSVLDLSVGGVLLEAPFQLKPGSSHVIEIIGPDGPTLAVSEVIRCKVSLLGGELRYRGACSFRRPLDIPILIQANGPAARNVDAVIKNFVTTYIGRGECAESASAAAQEAQWLADALQRLRGMVMNRPHSKFEVLFADILEDAVAALRDRVGWNDARGLLEKRLHRAFPQLDARIVGDPQAVMQGAESFQIALDSLDHQTDQFLKVGLPQDYALEPADFRLFKATSEVMKLLRAWDYRRLSVPGTEDAAAQAAAGATQVVGTRQDDTLDRLSKGFSKIVVRYLDGLCIRGYSSNFHPSQRQFRVWPSMTAQADQCRTVNIAELKAVFFVKDFDGDSEYSERKTFEPQTRGRKLEVTFLDGEVLVGSTLAYQPTGHGFLLAPADGKSNNMRAFIVRSATRQVRFV